MVGATASWQNAPLFDVSPSTRRNMPEATSIPLRAPCGMTGAIGTDYFLTMECRDPMWGLRVFLRLKAYKPRKMTWDAHDIIMLPGGVMDDRDKIFIMLRPELIADGVLHKLACDFAEHAQEYADIPAHEALDAIAAKRMWMSGLLESLQPQRDAIRRATMAASRRSYRSIHMISALAAAWFAADDVGHKAARSAAHYSIIAAEAAGRKGRELSWELDQIFSAILYSRR